MGARLTRYDAEALTLEARVRRFGIATVITIAAHEEMLKVPDRSPPVPHVSKTSV